MQSSNIYIKFSVTSNIQIFSFDTLIDHCTIPTIGRYAHLCRSVYLMEVIAEII